MRRTTGCTTKGPLSGKDAVRTTRLRWFTGRFITARDLTDEQEYHLDRHRLHNRLLHGWGVICGLQVHPHDRQDCAHEWVWVEPGIALDCHGREIVLPCQEAVQWEVDPTLTSDEDALAVLCLRYQECLTEPLPAIVDGCQHGTATQPGRVVERWHLEVHPVSKEPGDPWAALVRGDTNHPCRDDCDPLPDDDGCLQPRCEHGDCVPIALLSRCRGGAIEIDTPRNGVRPAVGPQDRVGVNPYTFLVEFEDSSGARERLPYDHDRPPRVESGCEAVFTIDPDYLRASGQRGGTRSLVGDTVFVTLLGDLVHDCHGLPVDADFFGSFPTGDGVTGGVLRSWFFVTDEKEARE